MNKTRRKPVDTLLFVVLAVAALLCIAPIFIILENSFKGRFFISDAPFDLPNSETFVGIKNYINGIEKTGFFQAFGYTLFITVFAVAVIVLFSAMTAWYITRVKSKYSTVLYYLFILAMIVPFQMVMFTMTKMANILQLDNLVGIIVIYLGFGASQPVFMFSGFVKGLPIDIEEAALIDGCSPIKTFFKVVFPLLKPIYITVAILNTMWVWNDYLLPYLLIGTKYRTLSVAVQYLQTGYGSKDMGAMMAVLILVIIPIIIFYLTCQKYIVKGVVAGAVKG